MPRRRLPLLLLLCLLGVVPAAVAADWKIGEPIVTYWAGPGYPGGGPLDDAAASRLVDSGYNLAWASEKELDTAHRHHLRGLLTDPLLTPASFADAKNRDALAALLERVKRHPCLYAYQIIDEPGAAAFPALGELVSFLRQRDPAHLAYINLLPIYATNDQLGTKGEPIPAYAEYLKRFTETVRPALLSYDHYQFQRDGDAPQYFLNLRMVRDRASEANVPFLNIVQASSWVPGTAASPTSPRVPTPDELRFLVYTSLAYGAQGISYYVYRYPDHQGGMLNPDGSPTALGSAASGFNREFVAIARELQPLRSIDVQSPGRAVPLEALKPGERADGLLVGRFGPADAETHTLVVNLDHRAERITDLKPFAPTEIFDALTGRWEPSGDRTEVRLPPGGGKLIRKLRR